MFQAERATPTEFRDSHGYDLVGACCALETCGLRDFLPFLCRFCGKKFCQDHADAAKHSCTAQVESKGVLASTCSRCGGTVKWQDGQGSEAEALQKHVCTASAKKSAEICPAEGCKTKMTTMNSVVCSECKSKVCLKHRFEDQHPCRESKAQWLSRLGSAASRPASTYGSGTTGGTTGVPAATTKPLGRLVENVANADARPEPEASGASAAELLQLRKSLGGAVEQQEMCLQTLRKLLSNVAKEPGESKFRKVRRENKAIKEKILDVPGGEDFMKALGFQENGDVLELPPSVTVKRIDAILKLVL